MLFVNKCVLEYIKCENDPVYWIKNYFTVKDLNCNHKLLELSTKHQDAIKALHTGQENLIMASRQVGKSTIVAAYLLWCSIFKTDLNIVIIGNSIMQSCHLLDKIRFAISKLPTFFRWSITVNRKDEIHFENGCKLMVKAANQLTLRGCSPSIVYIDEMAYIHEQVKNSLWQNLIPLLEKGTQFIAVSTPNGYELFYQLWEDALNGNGANAVLLTALDDANKDENYFKHMRATLSELSYRQEILCELVIH